jgi:hypothetical protein
VTEPDPVHDAAATLEALGEARRRATEQRTVAERLLEEARTLELRLSAETEQARAANEHFSAQRLAVALEQAAALERAAENHREVCAAHAERAADERRQAEGRLAQAVAADEAAQAESAAAERIVLERRAAREEAQAQLQAAEERASGFSGEFPSPAPLEELRALEARGQNAQRAAERRAADAARNALR